MIILLPQLNPVNIELVIFVFEVRLLNMLAFISKETYYFSVTFYKILEVCWLLFRKSPHCCWSLFLFFIGATESDLFLSLASKGALNGPISPHCWQFYPCFS